jgi:hypothetical protein
MNKSHSFNIETYVPKKKTYHLQATRIIIGGGEGVH